MLRKRPVLVLVPLAIALSYAQLPQARAQDYKACRMAEVGRQYAQAHNLKVREVKIDQGARKVARMFVPITNDAQMQDFVGRFQGKGCLVRQTRTDLEHPTLVMGPNKFLKYFKAGWQEQDPYMTAAQGGCLVPIALDQQRHKFMEKFYDKWHPQGDRAQFQQTVLGGQPTQAGCMWWLVHGKTGDNEWLSHYLGVSRSKAPSNLVKRMFHTANENVGPIGIVVGSAQEFDALPEARLLGAEPGGSRNIK